MKTVRAVIPVAILLCVAVAGAVVLTAQQKGKPKFNTWRAVPGRRRSSAVFVARSDQQEERRPAPGRVDVLDRGQRTYRFNPIVVDGVMYTLGKATCARRADAATGKEIWTHQNQGAIGDRGMNYWESADRKDRRLIYINGGFLTAVDAATGKTIETVRRHGRSRPAASASTATSPACARCRPGNPGRVYENLIIMSLPGRRRELHLAVPATPTRTTCGPANSRGRSTACPRKAKSAPRPGRKPRSRPAAASTTGAS